LRATGSTHKKRAFQPVTSRKMLNRNGALMGGGRGLFYCRGDAPALSILVGENLLYFPDVEGITRKTASLFEEEEGRDPD